MAPKTINGVPIDAIRNQIVMDPELAERIAFRKVKAPPIAMVESDAQWAQYFQLFRSRILAALEQSSSSSNVDILAINHVGSTSVPGLAAKAVIDIDLVLSSLTPESYYIPHLEAAGFQFLLREPAWYDHRFLAAHEPMSCNLHVFGPLCPEVERHLIFRDWLRKHDDDRDLYARTKRESAEAAREKEESLMEYNTRKAGVLNEILARALADVGVEADEDRVEI